MRSRNEEQKGARGKQDKMLVLLHYTLAQLRRDTEVLQLRKCSAKRKAGLTAM